MKNQSFAKRLSYALAGIRTAFQSESSFRIQCASATAAILFLAITRPQPVWWALVFISIAVVLAAELINTALEFIVDRLHPDQHPLIGKAKDCSAAAVLILSLSSLGVAAALILEYFK